MKNAFLLFLIIYGTCATAQKPAEKSREQFPDCIKQLIKKFEMAAKENPQRSIYSYQYHNQIVYYISAVCCDQYSDLYDGNCKLIGHPDGGLTGKGDGKDPDFNDTKTAEKLVWKDSRGRSTTN